MNPEKPNQPTPEEIAEMEKGRTISDAELLKGGAEYVIDPETKEKRIQLASYQTEKIIDQSQADAIIKIGMKRAYKESKSVKIFIDPKLFDGFMPSNRMEGELFMEQGMISKLDNEGLYLNDTAKRIPWSCIIAYE